MRTWKIWFIFVGLLMFGLWFGTALAQVTNELPPFDPTTADLPRGKDAYWLFVIAAVTPIVTLLVSKLVGIIPKDWLQSVAPVVALALGFGLEKMAGLNLPWWSEVLAGGFGVMVRELFNKQITERLKSDTTKIAELQAKITALQAKEKTA